MPKTPIPRSWRGAGGPASCGVGQSTARETRETGDGAQLGAEGERGSCPKSEPVLRHRARPGAAETGRLWPLGSISLLSGRKDRCLVPGGSWSPPRQMPTDGWEAFVLRSSAHPGFPAGAKPLLQQLSQRASAPLGQASVGRGFSAQRGGLCPGRRWQCWALLLGGPAPRGLAFSCLVTPPLMRT